MASNFFAFLGRVWVYVGDLEEDSWTGFFRRRIMWGRPVLPDYVDRQAYRAFDLFMEGALNTGILLSCLLLGVVCCTWGSDWIVPTQVLFPFGWTSWKYLLAMCVQEALQDLAMKYRISVHQGFQGISAIFPGCITNRDARIKFLMMCFCSIFIPDGFCGLGWIMSQ